MRLFAIFRLLLPIDVIRNEKAAAVANAVQFSRISNVWYRIRKLHDIPEYTVAILIPVLGGAISFLASDNSTSAVRWRQSLRKSRFAPSPSVTAIVWVLLYILMGHSSYLIYSHHEVKSLYSTPLLAYYVQLALNLLYILVLFKLQRIDVALGVIVPLWISTAMTAVLFYSVSKIAAMWMGLVSGWVTLNVYFNLVLFLRNAVYTEADLPPEEEPRDDKVS